MTEADLLLPDDDSFVRAAIQGLRAPSHLPDFWDQLAWRLDDALDQMTAQGLMELAPPPALAPDVAVPEPTPHHIEDPWPDPVPEIDLFGPVDEPVYEDDDELLAPAAPRGRAPLRADDTRVFVDAPAAPAPAARPRPRTVSAPRVQHDPSVVPMSLRRASNAVLLALAVLAAAMAVVAGVTLVRNRSEDSAPAPSEQASDGPDLAAATLPRQAR